MKIGIIGLRPRQLNDVTKRKFNGHEIIAYDEKSFPQERVAAFCRKVDRVVVVMGGLPKTAANYIPEAKAHRMFGSVSTVVNYLSTIPPDKIEEAKKTQPLLQQGMVAAPPAQPMEAPTDTMIRQTLDVTRQLSVTNPDSPLRKALDGVQEPVEAPKELACIMATGFASQYTWPPSGVVTQAAPQGKGDYGMLDAADAGDIIRFARPVVEGEPLRLDAWRARIMGLRVERKAKNNQLLEVHFYEAYVDLLVIDQTKHDPSIRKRSGGGRKAAIPTPAKESARFDVQDGAGADAIPMVDVPIPSDLSEPAPAEAPAPVDESIVAAPAATQPLPEETLTPPERGFWRESFMSVLRSGRSAEDAEMEANKAVLIYRRRIMK